MSLKGGVYELELSDINCGQKLIFDLATDDITRYIREWNGNKSNLSRIVQVTYIRSHIRIYDFELQDKLIELKGIVNRG